MCKRRVRVATANVGNDYQFQYFHICQVNSIVLNFASILRRAKVPLLTYNLAKSLIGFGAPAKNEFLRAAGLGLIEHQVDSLEPLRSTKNKMDSLCAGGRGTPALAISR